MIKSKIDSSSIIENSMVLVIVSTAIAMFYWSFGYSSDVAFFPQITSGIVIVIGVMILISNNLLKKEKGQAKLSSLIPSDTEERGGYALSTGIKTNEITLILLALLYLLVSVLFGIMWGTILFILTYAKWRSMNIKTTTIHLGLSVSVVYLFMEYMYIDMLSGLLFGGF